MPDWRPFGALSDARFAFDPVDLDAIDERPVDLAFLLLLPTDAQGPQLNALACVSRRVRDPEAAPAMQGARDAAALFATIGGRRQGKPACRPVPEFLLRRRLEPSLRRLDEVAAPGPLTLR